MLFKFLKYLQPTNYFQLYRKNGASIFPIISELPSEIRIQLNEDINFKSETSKEYDVSWQALQLGYIGDVKTYNSFEKVPLQDEYYFLRKYFNKVWVFYVLILRLVSLKNPIVEIAAFRKSKNVKRGNSVKSPINHSEFQQFESSLINGNRFLSIIIPTLNRYEYLKDVLADLEKQDYKNFEVIVVDQSSPYKPEFYEQFNLKIELIHQEERALWLARNHAIQLSKSEYILLFDDDSRVKVDWISNHLKCLEYFKADISSGTSISTVGAKVPENYSFFRISDQLDTGNVLLKKDIFRKIGLFDRQFEKQRMGDGEFGLRAYLEGYKNISNPTAQRLHLKVGSGGLREMGSWDALRTYKFFAPRPIPSVLYLFRKYYGSKAAILSLIKTVPPSIIPYKYKKNKKMLLLGTAISVFLLPIILFQVFISWRRASIKLKEGDKIGKLD